MSAARPALTLLKAAPRPGPRALEFIAWAVNTFGEPPTPAGVVVVRRSQSALLSAHDTVGSHGTVSWYMRQLRDAGVVVGTRPIAVDAQALAQFSDQPVGSQLRSPEPGPTADEPSPDVGHRSAVAELLAQRAEQQARLAQLQAELAITDAAIARAFIDADTATETAEGTREFADRAVAGFAKIREFRESGLASQEGRKVDLENSPSFLSPWLANRDREPRERSRTNQTPLLADDALTFDEVDEIIEPLRALCRATGRPDRVDDHGRRYLADLGRDALQTGIENYCPEAAVDPRIHSPMKLFIHRARQRDPDTFRPRANTAGRPTPTHASATDSVRPNVEASFEPTSPQPIDPAGLALAASPAGFSAARQSITTAIAATTPTEEETDS